VGLVVGALAVMGLGACGGSGAASRTIQVDYHTDDFAGAFLSFYPRDLTVTPGTTLKFHQTWSGEPHSVTFGTVANDGIKKVHPELLKLIEDYWAGKPLPEEAPESYLDIFEEKLPSFFGENGVNQTAAQPCFVEDESDIPKNGKACTKAQQKQREFTGREALYSSGFIPFEGSRGNSYEMKIADDAKPGTYFYYCNVHGGPMGGEITIKQGAKLESQASINRRGQKQADKDIAPVRAVLDKERAGKGKFALPIAGSGDESLESVEAFALEFTPNIIETKANTPVKWTFVGDHSISFKVPPYTPLFTTAKSGKVSYSERLNKAAGGWPGAPEGRDEQEGPPELVHLDAGKWDGSGGLHSSGTGFTDGDTYSVTFTKPGTYPYACLIHPGMIGKVVVK
jgi:plastocyanin